MKRIFTISLIAIAFSFLFFNHLKAQVAGWRFTGSGDDDPQVIAEKTEPGVVTSNAALTRGFGLTAVGANARGFHGTLANTSTVNIDLAKANGVYYQALIQIDVNYKLDLSALNYRLRRSGQNAPNKFMWTYNVSEITDAANSAPIEADKVTAEKALVFTNLMSAEGTYAGFAVGAGGDNGGDIQTPIDLISVANLQNLQPNKVLRLRLYYWFDPAQGTKNNAQTFGLGKSSASSTEYAVLNLVGISTLPVKLTSFTAKPSKSAVQLNWTTASEQNNSHFEILRSANGEPNLVIGRVGGNGTTSTENKYHFTDYSPLASAYYLLRQVDYNGDSQKSEVVFVNTNLNQNTLVAGAGNGKLVANYQSDVTTSANFSVVDLNGKIIFKKSVLLEKGANQIEVPLALNKGLYLSKLTEINGKTQSTKFIYQ